MSFDLTVVKGSTFQVGFILKPTPYSYQDITSFKFIIKIRPSKYSTTVLASWDETSSQIHIVNHDGSVGLTLLDAYTDAMVDFGNGVMNIWYYDPESTVGYVSDEYSIRFQP